MKRLLEFVPPEVYAKLRVTSFSRDFRKATTLDRAVAFPSAVRPTEAVVRMELVGVNASDVNYTAGIYKKGVALPFDCGFEGIGRVVALDGTAAEAPAVALGDAVVSSCFGAFSEYQVVPIRNLRRVPVVSADILSLEISGVTASVALEQVAPKRGETALVTAAAGGTGQFAVQLLKQQYGCKVFGTCSSDDKAAYLRSIGCDRPINYKTEDVAAVLAKEAPSGVHVIYESVGGKMFDDCVRSLAIKGRMVVLGNISGYADGSSFGATPTATAMTQPIGTTLLQKSASIHGFFLPHHPKAIPAHFQKLQALLKEGKLQAGVELFPDAGMDAIVPAVERLQSGRNKGKVVVRIQPPLE